MMIIQSAGMRLSILLLLFSVVAAFPKTERVFSEDGKFCGFFMYLVLILGKSTCSYCPAGRGLCSDTCRGYVCIKSVEHQSKFFLVKFLFIFSTLEGSERRYCMNDLEPGQPRPGECKNFTNDLGHSETICACTGDYCNSGDNKNISSGVRFLLGFATLFSLLPVLTSVF
jgi:hypothetical protein